MMSKGFEEGWFTNPEGHEMNVLFESPYVFITVFGKDKRAVKKYVYDIRKTNTDHIADIIDRFID